MNRFTTRCSLVFQQLRYRLCYVDKNYIRLTVVALTVFAPVAVATVFLVVVTNTVFSPVTAVLIPLLIASSGSLLAIELLREAHKRYARDQFELLYVAAREMTTEEFPYNDYPCGDIYHPRGVMRDWVAIPMPAERKELFIFAGTSPEEAMAKPMRDWTLEELDVYFALQARQEA